MSDDLRVDHDKPEDLYERLDGLVDTDPIALRDVAWSMARDVERHKARIAELEAYPAMLVDLGVTEQISDAHHEGFGAGIAHVEDRMAEQLLAAEARGYDRAIARLRYGQRIADHAWQANTAALDVSLRVAADYLEAVKERTE